MSRHPQPISFVFVRLRRCGHWDVSFFLLFFLCVGLSLNICMAHTKRKIKRKKTWPLDSLCMPHTNSCPTNLCACTGTGPGSAVAEREKAEVVPRSLCSALLGTYKIKNEWRFSWRAITLPLNSNHFFILFFSISSLCQDMITIPFLLHACPGN